MFKLVSNGVKNINEYDMNFIKDKFDYLPKYVYLYLYHYKNIIDLFNESSKKIFKKIDLFYVVANGFDTKLLEKIEKKEEIIEDDFEYDLFKTPLKYINYFQNEFNKSFHYEYAFPLIRDIIFEYNNFQLNEKIFLNEKNNTELGNIFLSIVKTYLKNYNIFEIDGYFEVNEIINMDLIGVYTKVDQNYILGKNVIFINQKIIDGEPFDFAIYKVKENNLILFKTKYIISSKDIKHRKDYIESSENISDLFLKKFNIKIDNIYLLYITSYEYNINNNQLIDILCENELNCLFYSVQKYTFSFIFVWNNLFFPINKLECEDNFRLIPESKYSNIIENYKDKILHSEGLPKNFKYNYDAFDKDVNTNMLFDCKEEYKKFTLFVNNECNISEDIKKKLGPFGSFEFYCFGEYYDKTLKEIKYYLVFSLEKKDEKSCQINYKENIGLVYYEGENECYLNLKDPKEKFDEHHKFKEVFYLKSFVKGIFISLK